MVMSVSVLISHHSLPNAIHIADSILATAHLYGMKLDPLQINKMCHLVNGFTLEERDEPAFYNNVEAWKYGPVIPEVYDAYRSYGAGTITHLETCRTPLTDASAVSRRYDELVKIIGPNVASIISGVVKEYGKFSGNDLVGMTHGKDTPWKAAYKPGRNNVIPTSTIRDFYRRLRPDDRGR